MTSPVSLSRCAVVALYFLLGSALPPSAAQSVNEPNDNAQKSAAHQTASFDNAAALERLIRDMQIDWPKNRIHRIVFHGHSVPAGYFRTPEVRRFDSYPMLFFRELCDDFSHATLDLSVTAIGGENSEQGAARFQQDVLSLKPSLVFVDYSLNDRRIGLERAARSWKSMILACHQAQVPIVLLTPTPDSREDITDDQSRLSAFRNQVIQLGRQYQVPVVDPYQEFQKQVRAGTPVDHFLSQSNHPNRRGHQVVADLLTAWLRSLPRQNRDAG